MTDFTSKQKEIVARKLGYDGPMQGFDTFVRSSPALQAKFSAVTQKYVEKMAKGGVVRKGYAVGGAVRTDFTKEEQDQIFANAQKLADASGRTREAELYDYAKSQGYSNADIDKSLGAYLKPGQTQGYLDTVQTNTTNAFNAGPATPAATPVATPATPAATTTATPTTTPTPTTTATPTPTTTATPTTVAPAPTTTPTTGVTGGGSTTFTDIGGKPQAAPSANVTAAQIAPPTTQELIDNLSDAPKTAQQATAQQAPASGAAATPGSITAQETTAAAATPALKQAMSGLTPATGDLSANAQVTGQTQDPTTSELNNVQAAQTAGTQVVAPAERTLLAGETVDGSAVDMARVDTELAKNQAAQGTVDERSTVQGQLATLTANFDASNPPSWAAGAVRAANAMLTARGLSSSSMAGQAIVQAAMESATPIAAADAQVFQQMGLQNLSNRQQTAILSAQQRAQFLGQEFDQTFQTKVLNASKVSDIANMNFSATQQIAIENSRLAQTSDLANLSNSQAVVMANAAQTANLETANLSNRQQASVVNAQSFLAMDMQNLNNVQQTALFKAQQITQGLLTDAAADNAAKQFNASSTNQTEQFMANLTSQVSQFNVAQQNALKQFNTDQANSIGKFNAETQNARDQFNSSQRLVIDQSNAQWRREISTANTASTNAANYLNAQNLQQMTLAEYNNETQLYRDQLEMVWSSYEKNSDRANAILDTEMQLAGGLQKIGAQASADNTNESSKSLGNFASTILADTAKSFVGSIFGIKKS
tara:strand:+ start:1670 stop:3976 length:2307 start_codon:yes stop_codon:yes gene_type:complete